MIASHPLNFRPLISAGVLLGIGMGGFVDGILFHQILQIHSMLSNTVPRTSIINLEVNMFWDGLFHAFTWLMTAAGIFLLWKAGQHRNTVPWATRTFIGSLILGWGIFNFVEGTIDHFLLQIHHVIQNSQHHWVGDLMFLASGVIFILVGTKMIKKDQHFITSQNH